MLTSRSLMPQGLADTLCGSPLYMAPEIIKNLKYDAKVMQHSNEIMLTVFIAIFSVVIIIF